MGSEDPDWNRQSRISRHINESFKFLNEEEKDEGEDRIQSRSMATDIKNQENKSEDSSNCSRISVQPLFKTVSVQGSLRQVQMRRESQTSKADASHDSLRQSRVSAQINTAFEFLAETDDESDMSDKQVGFGCETNNIIHGVTSSDQSEMSASLSRCSLATAGTEGVDLTNCPSKKLDNKITTVCRDDLRSGIDEMETSALNNSISSEKREMDGEVKKAADGEHEKCDNKLKSSCLPEFPTYSSTDMTGIRTNIDCITDTDVNRNNVTPTLDKDTENMSNIGTMEDFSDGDKERQSVHSFDNINEDTSGDYTSLRIEKVEGCEIIQSEGNMVNTEMISPQKILNDNPGSDADPSPEFDNHSVSGSVESLSKSFQSENQSGNESPKGSEDSDDDEDHYVESFQAFQWIFTGNRYDDDNLSTKEAKAEFGDEDEEEEDNVAVAVTDYDQVDAGISRREPTNDTADVETKVENDDVFKSEPGTPTTPETTTPGHQPSPIPPERPPKSAHLRKSSNISNSTTASEREFRRRYQAISRKVVQRKSSTQAYTRVSTRFFESDKFITLIKRPGDVDFGFHVQGSNPPMVSTVHAGSAADFAGLRKGDLIIGINGLDVVEATHAQVVQHLQESKETDSSERIDLVVSSDRLNARHRTASRDVTVPVCTGYLFKQCNNILKTWKKRWFVLKQDNCLYYYKNEQDKDPLGAILLANYTIVKATDINKRHAFKATKYGEGVRTYYFVAESETDMNRWATSLNEAAANAQQMDPWLDISSHNVGLPALSIKNPDCHGYLTKMGNNRKTWRRRYCVLKDACLYYYVDVTSSTAKGVAHFHGYTVAANANNGKRFGFTLRPPEDRMRTFCFYADKGTDKERWISAFQKSIGRWKRAD